MFQAIACDLFLYGDHSCLVYQHRDVEVIEQKRNKFVSNGCD